jgi:hypothetical protein
VGILGLFLAGIVDDLSSVLVYFVFVVFFF